LQRYKQGMQHRPSVAIVSPATAEANNGNWRTAERWARLLRGACDVRILSTWPDAQAAQDDVLLALHARRSADAVQAWHEARGARGLAVVLTGTDLYGDLAHDARAQASVAWASRLVVLQDRALAALAPQHRAKAVVIYQSVATRRALPKPVRHFTALMVGHLRAVKSPQTFFEAARLLRDDPAIRLRHIGAAEDPQWADQARATEREAPGYRWLGPQPHGRTRAAIQRAHVLVHPSALEGGANVVMEAVCSGTPVLASRVDGNVGMLGEDYEGYFEHGDAAGLAALLRRCRAEQGADNPGGTLLARLRAQCALRAPLFAPTAERARLLRLIHELQESA
jgi:putative glycosyltransferase (TIGR04348 family)